MKNKAALLIMLLAIGAQGVKAQDSQGTTHRFTLQECLQYAYEHQDSMKNARLDIESANYKVKETIGIGLPQIDATANIQDYLKVPTTLLPAEFFGGEPGTYMPVKFGVKYQSSAGISINQLLFNGSYLVGLKASKTYKELSQRNYDRTKIATTTAVTKAYYQVLVNGEQLKLLDANVQQLEQQVKETSALNQQGFAEKIDVDRLNVLYNNLKTTRENTVQLLALGYQLLKFQMGMPVTDNLIIEDRIENVKLDSTAAVTDTAAYRNRVEFALLETQKKLNELDLQRIKSQFLPTLSAFGNASYNYQADKFGDLYDQRFPTTIIGLQLNVPIFSGFQRLNQVKQAKIAVEKSDNILHTVKNGILLEQESARTTYHNSLRSLHNQRSNMELAREVLRVSKIKYEQGVGSSLEVTQAQTALQEAENNYIQSLFDALISKVDLEKAFGRIE